MQSSLNASSGSLGVATSVYSAFGGLLGQVVWGSTNQIPLTKDPVGFGGQWGYYTDQSTGLVLMGHRYYNPSNGRFLTRDPIGYAGGVNLYGFVGNNPITGIDPEGTSPNTAGQIALGLWDDAVGLTSIGQGIAMYKTIQASRKYGVAKVHAAMVSGLVHGYTDLFDKKATPRARAASFGIIALSALDLGEGGAGGVEDAGAVAGSEAAEVAEGAADSTQLANRYYLGSHVRIRMAQRGITEDMVKVALRKGTRYWDPTNKTINYVLKNGFASGKDLLVGQNPYTGNITTAYPGTNISTARMVPIP